MVSTRVVITGLGVIASNGSGVEKFWANTIAGVSGLKPYDWGRKYHFKNAALGRVDDFHPAQFGLQSRDYAGHGRYLQFALAASQMALQDAKIDLASVDPFRFGVMIASAIADAAKMEENLLLLNADGKQESDPAWVGPHFYDNLDFGLAASTIAAKYGAAGAVGNLSTGCTAGLDALGFAFEQIRRGHADVMLAGASEAPLCPLSIGSFEALGALSNRAVEDVRTASCPYSLERDGFVIAEGCGVLLVESYEHAVARGATIYAEITGYASVNNAYHMTDLPADGSALARCIELALQDAGCKPEQVDHVSAHGSSTPQNDENETNAIKRALGTQAYKIPINSLKSMTGHALAAANAVEMVALCKEIQTQRSHPTINYQSADPACDLDYVRHESRSCRINTAIKLTSGFSGIHSVLVLQAVK